ncbi:hypothetical protein D8I30_13125 [Brevundimonas naejangsanensis]|uniref:Uncharacterized protein n=1 Tax=Brevundimonas naejangsanensis TaxID=588932 RepID=A0A494RR58_9CAUL|nr:hypothetical protein [Brevundimonas naejangsanensis]AYG96014.1 hypothetical protein D8I30_13125 [Brevundimonas naejangsanensis]
MDQDEDFGACDDPIYRAGVLMGRNQALTDVMERLLSPEAVTAGKAVRAIWKWVHQTQEELRTEMRVVFADLDADDEVDA